MSKVFISYLKEDKKPVEKLIQRLKSSVQVWVDYERLMPGDRWSDVIRQEISEGDYFIACFSEYYHARSRTYMNEELTIAIEEMRKRTTDRPWFIPVRLSDCKIPNRTVGAGETLRSLQWVDLFKDFEEGVKRILFVVTGDTYRSYIKSSKDGTCVQLDETLAVIEGWLAVVESSRNKMKKQGLENYKVIIRPVKLSEISDEGPEMIPYPIFDGQRDRMEMIVPPEPVIGRQEIRYWSDSVIDFLIQYIYAGEDDDDEEDDNL